MQLQRKPFGFAALVMRSHAASIHNSSVNSHNTLGPLMSQHLKNGEAREALLLYGQMQEEKVKPKTSTFVTALKACISIRDLATGKEIHAHAIESGHITDIFVASTLVDMYAKCGSIVDARRVFNKMPCRTIVSWNVMIMGYAQMQMGKLALQLFLLMQQEGFLPNARTFLAALVACSNLAVQEEANGIDLEANKSKCLRLGRALHKQVVTHGFESDKFIASTLVDMYAKCGSISEACQIFELMPNHNVVAWNAMIMGYAQLEMGNLALQLYARMLDDGFVPNGRTYIAILKACASIMVQEEKETDGELPKQRCLEECKSIHSQIANCRLESDMFVASTLVDVYAKCGNMVDACWLFENMEHHDVVSWTSIIMGYAQKDEGELALRSYAQMQLEGLNPDARTFVAALKACGCLAIHEAGKQIDGKVLKIRCLEKGRAIHTQVAKSGFESDVFIASTLVDMYAKCGSIVDSRQVFDRTFYRTVVLWNSMIMAYAEMEMGDLALQLYARLQVEGFTPDARTYVAALKACSSMASWEAGKEIHAQVCRVGLSRDVFIANSLLDMYCKCGNMADVQQIFESLTARNLVTWNSLIAGYGGQGENNCVFDLFKRMQLEGIQPDGVTFVSVLAACSHTGLLEKGHIYFQVMCLEYKISPANEHYSCMIDLLGRAGQVDEAVTLMKKMLFRPSAILWMVILSACQKWNKLETGRYAFECAVRSDEKHAAAYVLMTNISVGTEMLKENIKIQEI